MKTFLPLLLLSFSGSLWAQSGEVWFTGGASILWNHQIGSLSADGAPADVLLSNGFREGVRFGYNSPGHFGHEIQYTYNKTNLTDNTGMILTDKPQIGTAFHQAGYNLLYYFKEQRDEQKIRAFATAGVHLNDFVLPGSATSQGGSAKFGFNYGVGVKVKVSTLFAVRFDLRQYASGKPDWNGLLVHQSGLLYQAEASAGFGIYF